MLNKMFVGLFRISFLLITNTDSLIFGVSPFCFPASGLLISVDVAKSGWGGGAELGP